MTPPAIPDAHPADTWASVHMRKANPFAWVAFRLLCPREGFLAFTRVYGYFRWADDRVDAPGRDPAEVARFVARQRAVLAGARPEEAPEEALVRALEAPSGLAIRPAVERMWEALAFDAARTAAPLSEEELRAQVARVGDAWMLAMWVCSGAGGAPPRALSAASRAAALVHVLRDVAIDRALGYHNVPDDAGPDWYLARCDEAEAGFAEGEGALREVPSWRARVLVGIFVWRYRRVLRGQRTKWFQPSRR